MADVEEVETPLALDADDTAYIAIARHQYGRDGEIEIDDDAVISRGDKRGAYVAAWVWVAADVPETDDDEDDDMAGRCDDCERANGPHAPCTCNGGR